MSVRQCLIIGAEVLATLVGLVAAYFWWKSAQIRFEKIEKMPTHAGDGNRVIQLDNGQLLHFDAQKQAELNSKAASLTAVSVALQAIIFGMQALC